MRGASERSSGSPAEVAKACAALGAIDAEINFESTACVLKAHSITHLS